MILVTTTLVCHMHARRDLISVAEAASLLRLHPSRIRAMAQAQQLDAEKVAGRWLINRVSLEYRRNTDVVDGRPYSAANAWALLCLAEGCPVDWVTASALSRLRRKLRTYGLLGLAPRLRARAELMSLRAHSSALHRIAMEPDVVQAGASAAKDNGIDIQASDEVEAYVAHERVGDIVAKYHLEPSDRPNVLLRVVPDDLRFAWKNCIGGVLVAVDLFESQDPRSQRAARQFLERFEASPRDH